MIHVIATIEVHDGRREDLLNEFAQLVPLVRAEAGCVEYGPAIDADTDIAPPRANIVTVVEKWENLDALKVHLGAPHMVEFRSRVAQIVAKISLQILDPV